MNFQATSCCRICLKSELLMSIYLYSPTFPMRPIEIIEKLNIFKYDETLPALLCQSCLFRLLDAYNLQQLAEASERRLRDYIVNNGGSGLGLCGLSTNSINHDSSSFSSTAAMGDACKDSGVTAAIYANICDMLERNNVQANGVVVAENGGCMVTGDDILNDIEIDVSSLTRSEANEDTLTEVLASKHTNIAFNPGTGKTIGADVEITPETGNEVDVPVKMSEKCTECGKVFKNFGYLEAHRRLHTNEKPYQCKQCARQFKQSSNLLLHQRTHTGERRFQCEICANFFTTSSNLKAHKAIHLEHRDYRCSQCDREFKTRRELRRHEPVHKTIKDNVCEKCQRAFSKRSYLLDHIAVMHRGVRRHKCAECGKLFGRRSNLVSHMRIHSGEKPFECKFCPWKFNQSSALARHMKKHSKGKNVELGFKAADQVLKHSALMNILETPEMVVVAAGATNDVSAVNIAQQTSYNVLSNIANLGGLHCMNTECNLENTSTDTESSEVVEALQNSSVYNFTKNDILDFSTNQQVC
ncbi:zinc finger protein 184-like isoform X1 [Rhagoletis pomonella]|uniref:zinc finger protein 184-like isoform X1 n=2 Tax=Rhagoletis pomonella TaxID=28610 RepID=UPI00177FD0A1|nr:zinc finger protein 184-like isoform X1 [Rhagoletis pomonella]